MFGPPSLPPSTRASRFLTRQDKATDHHSLLHNFWRSTLFAPALGATTLTLPLLARLGGVQRQVVMRSWGLVGLMLVQGLLIDLGRWVWMPISSLHPVNALALILVAYTLAPQRRRSVMMTRRNLLVLTFSVRRC